MLCLIYERATSLLPKDLGHIHRILPYNCVECVFTRSNWGEVARVIFSSGFDLAPFSLKFIIPLGDIEDTFDVLNTSLFGAYFLDN